MSSFYHFKNIGNWALEVGSRSRSIGNWALEVVARSRSMEDWVEKHWMLGRKALVASNQ